MRLFAAKCLAIGRLAAITLSLLTLTVTQSRALILYGGDNYANTDGSGTTAPFSDVIGVMNSTGTAYDASGVYLGGGYVLTAQHVNLYSSIELGGVQYSIDYSYTPTQIGTADLKLFKISGTTAASNVVLDANSFNDTNKFATIVGYGRGIGSATTSGYLWGDSTTADQRWGTNTVSSATIGYNSGNNTTTSCLITVFDTNAGANEAALALGDSGGALFEYVGGQWVLSGISIGAGPIYGESQYGDDNYFARVSAYSSTISSMISAVPEPETYLLFILGGVLIVFALHRRERRTS